MLPASRVQQSTAVLRALVECVPENGVAWIRNACAALPPGAQTDAEGMLSALSRVPISSAEVRRAVDSFSDACRRKRLVQ